MTNYFSNNPININEIPTKDKGMPSDWLPIQDRTIALMSLTAAEKNNQREREKNNPRASEKLVFPNQLNDCINIVNKFLRNDFLRVVSLIKMPKLGANGILYTLPFIFSLRESLKVDINNIVLLTGFSSINWQLEVCMFSPSYLQGKVFHNGDLSKATEIIKDLENGVILIDECDVGEKIDQRLSDLLKSVGLHSYDDLVRKNIRVIFVSATNRSNVNDLLDWNNDEKIRHLTVRCSIPDTYVSPDFLLKNGMVKNWVKLKDKNTAFNFIKEYIIEWYGCNFKTHFIRIDTSPGSNQEKNIRDAVEELNKQNEIKIEVRNHNSKETITPRDFENLYDNLVNNRFHVIILIKGMLRRADLIPTEWKKKIGVLMDKPSRSFSTGTVIQSLPGRACGHYKQDLLEMNERDRPIIFTSVLAIKEYTAWFEDPEGYNGTYHFPNSKKVRLTNKNEFCITDSSDSDSAASESDDDLSSYLHTPIKLSNIYYKDLAPLGNKKYNIKMENVVDKLKEKGFNDLNGYKILQRFAPSKDTGYNKNVLSVIEAWKNKMPYIHSLKKEQKRDGNKYAVMVIDLRNEDVYVMKYR